ncbi:MAG: type 4a pilus biogenesis protein PilO [Thermodesulfobacteriota bacterium]
MRSNISIKGAIMAMVIFFIAVSSFFYFFLYLPKMNKVKKGMRTISLLNGRVETAVQEVNQLQERIERFNKDEVNVDFFKRHQILPERRTPTFLEKMNGLVNRLGIKTIMVKPLPEEESPDYIRYPFLVEARSKYEEIVKFIDSLENSFKLNLDDLHIENDPKAPLWHRVKFTVSTFELKGPESSPSHEKGEVKGAPLQIVVRNDITVKRDPFLEKKLRKGKKVARASIRKVRRKRVPPLKLKGIIDIAGKKVAIMNDKIVREGDWIAKHRIVRIGEDEVIVVYGRKKRTLKIEALVKSQQR